MSVAGASSHSVSIIVPVYNAAQYLRACLNSVLSQNVADIEVICVDDASTDSSVDLLKEIAACDPRVKIEQLPQNSGAPAARNLAITKCNGEYLLFLDADDMLLSDSLAPILFRAKRLGSDAIKGLMYVGEKHTTPTPHHLNQTTEQLDTSLSQCAEIQHLYQYQSYLIRASLVRANNLCFNTRLHNFQDPVFLSEFLPLCHRIDVTLHPLYLRNIVAGSIITSTWNYDNFFSLTEGVEIAYRRLTQSGHSGAARQIALSFTHWWHKLVKMPVLLSRQQCFNICTRIHRFTTLSADPISEPRPGYMSIHRVLTFIEQGNFKAAIARMERISKRRISPPRSFTKLIDIPSYLNHRMRGQHRSDNAQ